MRSIRIALAGLAAVATIPALADVVVERGPTMIPRGDAVGENDLTISNGRFAVAFAVDTAPPWGVARGGIVDIALINDGEVGYDIASLADFMPNNWSAWPTSYQDVRITEQSAARVIIETRRDWGEVDLVTTFTIRDDDPHIDISTTMINGSKTTLSDLLTGYVVWPDGGYLFGVPGLSGLNSSSEENAFGNWSAAYDRNWALGLHAEYSEVVTEDGRDRYLPHDLAAGESKTFDATLQIESVGDLSLFVRSEAQMADVPVGSISGLITDSSAEKIDEPAVIALRNGKVFAWTIGSQGRYDFALPAGDYEIYATGDGYTRSAISHISVTAGESSSHDFSGLQPPGTVALKVVDAAEQSPLDARISIAEGSESTIEFLGKNTFFTELEPRGAATLKLAPGNYQLRVSAGGGFLSLPTMFDVSIEPGHTSKMTAEIAVVAMPAKLGWYSADLHHHSDVLDGFSKPEFVLRSELASGVDVTFLSDHDSMINNEELGRLSKQRGVDFIAGTEMSPSWAHFNAYPIDDGKTIDIDVGASPVQDIFTEARRLGADVIHVNHPYGDYGYFQSLETEGAVPGDYDDDFDVVEITEGDNTQTLERTWALWNSGKKAYLAGGSDVHDVWDAESGTSRTYAHVSGKLSADKFVAAVKRGNSYASQGPLIFPDIVFGTEIQHAAGEELALAFSIQAVNGLSWIRLIEGGSDLASQAFAGETEIQTATFRPRPMADTWYSVIVEDGGGKKAYSNPIWVRVEQ